MTIQQDIDTLLDPALDKGGIIALDSGDVVVGTGLVVDYSGLTGNKNTNQKRVSIHGTGATDLQGTSTGMKVLTFKGSSPLNSGSYQMGAGVRGLNISGDTTMTGLYVENVAWFSLDNFTSQAIAIGLHLKGAVYGAAKSINITWCNIGVLAEAGASHCNARTWTNGTLGHCFQWGMKVLDGMSSGAFYGLTIEHNGTHGDMSTGGMSFEVSGSQGQNLPAFRDMYFEGNRGYADVLIKNTGSTPLVVSMDNCTFRRIFADKHTRHNIVTVGDVRLSLTNCSFTGVGSYVPDASRQYVLQLPDANGVTGAIVNSTGTVFSSQIEAQGMV